jgi:hypothetical protein
LFPASIIALLKHLEKFPDIEKQVEIEKIIEKLRKLKEKGFDIDTLS